MRDLKTSLQAGSQTIGKLSEDTGVAVETIRYYERIGLLPPPPRNAGRRRIYAKEHRQRLKFIRRARELGFTLGQIRQLLLLSSERCLACEEVKAITDLHIADMRRKIRDLTRLERILSGLVTRCRPNDAVECPILGALSDE